MEHSSLSHRSNIFRSVTRTNRELMNFCSHTVKDRNFKFFISISCWSECAHRLSRVRNALGRGSGSGWAFKGMRVQQAVRGSPALTTWRLRDSMCLLLIVVLQKTRDKQRSVWNRNSPEQVYPDVVRRGGEGRTQKVPYGRPHSIPCHFYICTLKWRRKKKKRF